MMIQVIVSDLNRTPIVQIITWFTLATSLLAFFTHAAIKFYVFRSLTTESWFVLVSLVFCVAQSAAVSLQAHYGFGTPMSSLSDYQIESNLKSEYSAMILFIVSLGFSKLAVVAFVHHLTPSRLHRRINFGILAILGFFNQEIQDAALREDLTLGYWRSSICNQIVQCLAIVTTCLPYTKLFMEGFESGLMRLDDLRRRGEQTTKEDSKGYQLMDMSRSGPSEQSGGSQNVPNRSRSIQVSTSWAVKVEPAARVPATITLQ
ncbi:hypothetical protein CFE70_001060 [Pyrenophora teres f. teres 0-1]